MKILQCRRSIIAIIGMLSLLTLGLVIKADVSGAIATIVIAVCGANAAQNVFQKKDGVS